MYQLIVASFLGIKQKGEQLYFDPSTPPAWASFSVRYKYMDTMYDISFKQAGAGENKTMIYFDGNASENTFLQLVNDGKEHKVEVVLQNG